jgi:hypothetical protein
MIHGLFGKQLRKLLSIVGDLAVVIRGQPC